jgi:hypothetical protein
VLPNQPRGGAFIEHHGDDVLFFKMKNEDIRCHLSPDPETMLVPTTVDQNLVFDKDAEGLL